MKLEFKYLPRGRRDTDVVATNPNQVVYGSTTSSERSRVEDLGSEYKTLYGDIAAHLSGKFTVRAFVEYLQKSTRPRRNVTVLRDEQGNPKEELC